MEQGHVLLVEDEEDIQELVSNILHDAGYRVMKAINAEVALIFLREHELPIDLLLTDVVMPGAHDGFALAREAKVLRPELRVLYMTGFVGVARIRAQGAPFGQILQKPWRVEDLLTAVRKALD